MEKKRVAQEQVLLKRGGCCDQWKGGPMAKIRVKAEENTNTLLLSPKRHLGRISRTRG